MRKSHIKIFTERPHGKKHAIEHDCWKKPCNKSVLIFFWTLILYNFHASPELFPQQTNKKAPGIISRAVRRNDYENNYKCLSGMNFNWEIAHITDFSAIKAISLENPTGSERKGGKWKYFGSSDFESPKARKTVWITQNIYSEES